MMREEGIGETDREKRWWGKVGWGRESWGEKERGNGVE